MGLDEAMACAEIESDSPRAIDAKLSLKLRPVDATKLVLVDFSTVDAPSPRALIVSTNQRLPDRWRVKTMKRFGSSVTLHRAGAARRARTAFEGPAPRALVASATTARHNCRACVIECG